MNFHTLRNLIKRGEIAPVYYFIGREKILAEILSEEIIKKKIPLEERDFSVFRFELAESNWEEIVSALSTSSFFSTNKVVIVKTGTPTRKKKNESSKEIYSLKKFLFSLSNSSYLIVISDEKDPELLEMFKSCQSCTIFFLYPLKPEEIEILIEEKVRENEKTITPSEKAIIVEEAQEDLSLALKDLEKIIVYMGDKEKIEKEEMESLVSFSGRFKIDELIGAIDSRDKFLTFKIIEDIMDNLEPVFLIGTLARVFSRKYNNLLGEESQIKIRNFNKEEREKVLNIIQKRIKKIEYILKIIFETDIKIKSNPFNKGMIEEMIVKIIEGEGLLGNERI